MAAGWAELTTKTVVAIGWCQEKDLTRVRESDPLATPVPSLRPEHHHQSVWLKDRRRTLQHLDHIRCLVVDVETTHAQTAPWGA